MSDTLTKPNLLRILNETEALETYETKTEPLATTGNIALYKKWDWFFKPQDL